jgi:hypothetical protein
MVLGGGTAAPSNTLFFEPAQCRAIVRPRRDGHP